MTSFNAHGTISKVDDDKRQVFGWASVTDLNGEPVTDRQNDWIAADELEKAVYDYVLKSRVGGTMHERVGKSQPKATSEMIESFVITPEKIEKMGLPEGSLPIGWWTGFQVRDEDTWNKVKKGELMSFSIHGMGKRQKVDKQSIKKNYTDDLYEIYKACEGDEILFVKSVAYIADEASERGHPDAAFYAEVTEHFIDEITKGTKVEGYTREDGTKVEGYTRGRGRGAARGAAEVGSVAAAGGALGDVAGRRLTGQQNTPRSVGRAAGRWGALGALAGAVGGAIRPNRSTNSDKEIFTNEKGETFITLEDGTVIPLDDDEFTATGQAMPTVEEASADRFGLDLDDTLAIMGETGATDLDDVESILRERGQLSKHLIGRHNQDDHDPTKGGHSRSQHKDSARVGGAVGAGLGGAIGVGTGLGLRRIGVPGHVVGQHFARPLFSSGPGSVVQPAITAGAAGGMMGWQLGGESYYGSGTGNRFQRGVAGAANTLGDPLGTAGRRIFHGSPRRDRSMSKGLTPHQKELIEKYMQVNKGESARGDRIWVEPHERGGVEVEGHWRQRRKTATHLAWAGIGVGAGGFGLAAIAPSRTASILAAVTVASGFLGSVFAQEASNQYRRREAQEFINKHNEEANHSNRIIDNGQDGIKPKESDLQRMADFAGYKIEARREDGKWNIYPIADDGSVLGLNDINDALVEHTYNYPLTKSKNRIRAVPTFKDVSGLVNAIDEDMSVKEIKAVVEQHVVVSDK